METGRSIAQDGIGGVNVLDGVGGINAIARPVLVFSRFTLDRDKKQLAEGARVIKIGSRAFDLLAALLEAPGELLSRERLVAAVWPDTLVEETSLRVQVSGLRKALREADTGETIIANVPGSGYRVAVTVAEVHAAGTAAQAAIVAHASQVAAGAYVAPPASAPFARRPGNLPSRWAEPIGRDALIAALAACLGHARLLSLVGAGGIGKTALALAVGQGVAARFRDGVWFVDLAPLADPGALAAAVARALGLAAPAGDSVDALSDYLHERQLLIVLDTCDHLLAAVAALAARLLAHAPALRLLATSREQLGVAGEDVHQVGALALPRAGDSSDPARAARYPAVRLFVERAQASDARFALTPANVAAVCRLCRQLGGVPLAIELAASRVGALGMGALIGSLAEVLGVLAEAPAGAVARHASLQALLSWSVAPLAPVERRVFARLSIFAGAFTLEAAAAVCACADIAPADAAAAVARLVACSLLVAAPSGEQRGQCLPPLARACAADLLAASGEYAAIAARHAHHVGTLLAHAAADLHAISARRWLARHGRCDELRAALRWAFGPGGDTALGLELCACAKFSLYEPDARGDYAAMLHLALAKVAEGGGDAAMETRLLCSLALLASQNPIGSGSLGEAAIVRRLKQLLPQLHANDTAQLAMYSICTAAFGQGDNPAVLALAQRAAEMAALASDAPGQLLADRFLALALHNLGQHGAAKALALRVMLRAPADPVSLPASLHARAGDAANASRASLSSPVPRMVSMLILLARLAWLQGDPERAPVLARQALARAQGEHPLVVCQALALALIPVALWRGDDAAAATASRRLLAHATQHGIAYWQSWAHNYLHVLALRGGAPAAAVTLWRMPANAMERDMLATISTGLLAPETVRRVDGGMVLWCGPEVLRVQAERLLPAPDADAAMLAETLLLRSLHMARQQGALAWQLRTATSLARAWAAAGRVACALHLLAEVLARFEAGGASADLLAAREQLARLSPQSMRACAT